MHMRIQQDIKPRKIMSAIIQYMVQIDRGRLDNNIFCLSPNWWFISDS